MHQSSAGPCPKSPDLDWSHALNLSDLLSWHCDIRHGGCVNEFQLVSPRINYLNPSTNCQKHIFSEGFSAQTSSGVGVNCDCQTHPCASLGTLAAIGQPRLDGFPTLLCSLRLLIPPTDCLPLSYRTYVCLREQRVRSLSLLVSSQVRFGGRLHWASLPVHSPLSTVPTTPEPLTPNQHHHITPAK